MLESRAVRMHLRPVVAGLVFAVIVLGALDPRPLLRIEAHAVPDRKTSDYPLFLEEVARRTARGDMIAILVPMRDWSHGQSYAYYRASYFLAGRRVIPLVDPDDSRHPERLVRPEYVAVWRMSAPPGPHELVWSGHGGMLLRRRP